MLKNGSSLSKSTNLCGCVSMEAITCAGRRNEVKAQQTAFIDRPQREYRSTWPAARANDLVAITRQQGASHEFLREKRCIDLVQGDVIRFRVQFGCPFESSKNTSQRAGLPSDCIPMRTAPAGSGCPRLALIANGLLAVQALPQFLQAGCCRRAHILPCLRPCGWDLPPANTTPAIKLKQCLP